MFPPHLYPEKSGVGRGTSCRFFLPFREASPAQPSLNPEVWLHWRLNQAEAAWSKDLCSAGTQGSPHPAQPLQGAASQAILHTCWAVTQLPVVCGTALLTPTDQPILDQLHSWGLTNQAKSSQETQMKIIIRHHKASAKIIQTKQNLKHIKLNAGQTVEKFSFVANLFSLPEGRCGNIQSNQLGGNKQKRRTQTGT